MNANSDRWTQLDSAPLIAIFEYSFGPGTATALAVGVDLSSTSARLRELFDPN